jgi:hypothetical protein
VLFVKVAWQPSHSYTSVTSGTSETN